MNISQLESLAFSHYAAVTGKNYIDDETVYLSLKNEVIPRYERFVELLKSIAPDDDALRKLHLQYVEGAGSINDGFKTKMMGLKQKDQALIRLANLQIEAGAKAVDQWRSGLNQLISDNKSIRLKDRLQ